MMFQPDSTTNSKQPILLNDAEMADPQWVINEFVSYYHLPECRFYGWEMFTATLDACDQGHHTDFPPSSIHVFASNLLRLFEALHLLAERTTNEEAAIHPGKAPSPAPEPLVETGALPGAYARLAALFDNVAIEYLYDGLWQWFKAIFEEKPFSYPDDPLLLLHLQRQLLSLVKLAKDILEAGKDELPAIDNNPKQQREHRRELSSLYHDYCGRITCLNPAEALAPRLFLQRFFKLKSREDWDSLLGEWLEYGLSTMTVINRCDTADMPGTFELLRGLCEACWLLHRSHQKAVAEPGLPEQPVTAPAPADDMLTAIINMICASMEVEQVFLVGKYPLQPPALGEEYDLLVLVKDGGKRPMDELESYVQNRSAELSPVHATVMKAGKAGELLKAGNWYFNHCCTAASLVYGGEAFLSANKRQTVPLNRQTLAQEHASWLGKSKGFMEGARGFFATGEYALCCFMLHQAVEHGLNALLVPLLQYRLKTHNLHKLLRFVRRFDPVIFGIFPRDTQAETSLFRLLQHAYIHARYKDRFAVQEAEAAALVSRVAVFMERLPVSFQQITTNLSL